MNDTPGIRRRRLWLSIVCLIVCTLNIIAYQPGFMSPDTLEVYEQALNNSYSDWHPPVMAILWHMLLYIQNGPLPMLIFQMLLLWGSIYLLLDSHKEKRWYILIAVFTFLPFVQNFPGYIIKDSHMALSLLFATALMYRAYAGNRKLSLLEIILTALLIIYGGIVRPNALPAIIPLCVLFGSLQAGARKRRMALFSTVLLGAVLLGNTLQNTVSGASKTYPVSKLYMHDLTGIFVKTGEDVFPPQLYTLTGLDTSYLRNKYSEATFDHIWWNNDNKKILPAPVPGALADTLKQYWAAAISGYPDIYLHNRLTGFMYFLRLKKYSEDFYYHSDGIPINKYGFKYHGTAVSQIFKDPIELQGGMPYMRPWFWLFVNIALLFFIKRLPTLYPRMIFTVLVLSSLFYILPTFFLFQVDTDFRYMYWNCIACTLALILLIYHWRDNKKAAA